MLSFYTNHKIENLGLSFDIPKNAGWDFSFNETTRDWFIKAPEEKGFIANITLGPSSLTAEEFQSATVDDITLFLEEAALREFENYKLLTAEIINLNEGQVRAILRKAEYSGLGYELATVTLTVISPFSQYWIMVGTCLRSEQKKYVPIFEHIFRSIEFIAPALTTDYVEGENEERDENEDELESEEEEGVIIDTSGAGEINSHQVSSSSNIAAKEIKGDTTERIAPLLAISFERIVFPDLDIAMKVPTTTGGATGWTLGYAEEDRPLIILTPQELDFRAGMHLQFLNFDNPTIEEITDYVQRSQKYVLQEYIEPKVSPITDVQIAGKPGVVEHEQ